jgi:hypothetical protein
MIGKGHVVVDRLSPSESGYGSVSDAGRGGRARTCDNRFWRPVLYQLSYTPRGTCVAADPGRFKHGAGLKSKGEAAGGRYSGGFGSSK